MKRPLLLAAASLLLLLQGPAASAFAPHSSRAQLNKATPSCVALPASNGNENDDTSSASLSSPVEEYRNAPTKILSNFMSSPSMSPSNTDGGEPTQNPIDSIDFNAPKINAKVDLETLASILDYELYTHEWLVTGRVQPQYFSQEFEFQDPDVKLNGIEEYARGVYKLFDQTCSRAEIISTEVNPEIGSNVITCTWRLSGKVNIGPGLTIKPYLCYSDLTVDEITGLIVRQEDRFDIPQWDILLSALFPFLIGKVTKAPAPEVKPRLVPRPSLMVGSGSTGNGANNPLEKIFELFGGAR